MQFLFVIISGIHASELRKPREDNELPLTQVLFWGVFFLND